MHRGDDGDWRQWDRLWQDAHRYERMLYCRDEPQSLKQLLHRAYFEDLWRLLGSPAVGQSVELGAGRGTMSMYLSQRGQKVSLVDLSGEALEIAMRHFVEQRLPRPAVLDADARDCGLPTGQFDCVCSTGLLEHFHDPRPVLSESLRLLRSGGILFHIIVPEVDKRRSLPLRGTLNPFGAILRAVKDVARPLLKEKLPYRNGSLRTRYSRRQWLSWLGEIEPLRFACLPYNPLHRLYRAPLLERSISLPLWRGYLSRRRRRNKYPLLATSASLAQCLLLVARKS